MKQEKRSGILGGGFGFTIGTESQKNTLDGVSLTQAISTVGSVKGNVDIRAGEDVKIEAADIISGQNTKITGENVTIEAGIEKIQEKQSYEYQRSGLTVSLSSPAIDTIRNITTEVKRAAEVSDSRLSALYDLKAAGEVAGLGQKIDNTVNGQVGKDKNGNVVRTGRDISINIGFGSTSKKQTSTSEIIQAKGSQITAGGNIDITATGSNKQDGNVVINGSTVTGDTVRIQAPQDVILASAENQATNYTQSNGKSSGIGVQLGVKGVGVYVEGSKTQGIENGTTVNYTPSVVTAKDTLKIESGNDTDILGSKANGERVEIRTGNDLNIASQQDIDNYFSKNSSSGGIIGTGGIGAQANVSKGRIDSNYASVTDQAGIYAGQGGFDITVGKNTDLKGAVIASEATPDKNKLSTDTLTWSDIQNKAEYSASSNGISLDLRNKTPIVPIPGIPVNGKADSTTKSAISPSTIDVRSGNTDISKLSRNTDQALNALGKIFDKETVKEKQELINLFSQEANKAIGDYAESMRNKASTPEEKAKWAEGGVNAGDKMNKNGDQKMYIKCGSRI